MPNPQEWWWIWCVLWQKQPLPTPPTFPVTLFHYLLISPSATISNFPEVKNFFYRETMPSEIHLVFDIKLLQLIRHSPEKMTLGVRRYFADSFPQQNCCWFFMSSKSLFADIFVKRIGPFCVLYLVHNWCPSQVYRRSVAAKNLIIHNYWHK